MCHTQGIETSLNLKESWSMQIMEDQVMTKRTMSGYMELVLSCDKHGHKIVQYPKMQPYAP